MHKYFTTFDIKESSDFTLKDTYRYIDLRIESKTTLPKNFYTFIDELKSLNNIIELIYPIEFKAQNNYLYINFNLRIYTFYD